jgi:cytochrome c5
MASAAGRRGRSWTKILLWAIGVAVAVFLLIQFVPYGRSSHSNPAAANPFRWTDPQAEAIAQTSCYDCHSNETKWWWATNIAPMSWLVQRDVDGARAAFNFSDWNGLPSAGELGEAIDGEMPPFQYTMIHPDARLTDAEKRTLLAGFEASLAANGPQSSGGTPSATPSASPTATTRVTAEATAIIEARCGSCHPTGQALSFRAGDAAEAQALIDAMVQRGATVSADETQTLVDYFTQ